MAIGSTALNFARKLAKRIFRQEEDARLRGIADLLESMPMFAPLTRGMLIELAEAFHERLYRKDEYLYYEGDPGIGLYIVRSGTVRLTVDLPDAPAKRIRDVGPSEILGATCLLGGGTIKRSESARAIQEAEVIGLFSPEFRTLLRRHPKTGAAVATLLARHFAEVLTELGRSLADSTDPVRAARMLAEASTNVAGRSEPPAGW
jgi:CRP-like cAMP-binding protein